MADMARVILVLSLLFFIGLLVEYLRIKSPSVTVLTYAVKRDSKLIFKAFFSQEVPRHQFSVFFVNDIKNIVSSYANKNFDPLVGAGFTQLSLPYVYATFISASRLGEDELHDIALLIRQKMLDYLCVNRLDWRFFIVKTKQDFKVTICIYYCEHEDDVEEYDRMYASFQKVNSPVDIDNVIDDTEEETLNE